MNRTDFIFMLIGAFGITALITDVTYSVVSYKKDLKKYPNRVIQFKRRRYVP